MAFTSPTSRIDPPLIASEKEMLLGFLDYHRATLLMKLDGLDEEQVRRSFVPSGTSLLGLVKHLTEVEHSWFVRRIARHDEPFLFRTEADQDAEFRIESDETTDSIVAGYLAACDSAREIMNNVDSLDSTYEHERHGTMSVRWTITHMIEETARHNGHADIIRELIDGEIGE